MGSTTQRAGWAKIPPGYFSAVKQLQKALNDEALAITDTLPQGENITGKAMQEFINRQTDYEISAHQLLDLRDLAAKIRYDGYGLGYSDEVYAKESDVADRINLANPYPKGTGARECWIRGYCQGRSIKRIVQPTEYLRGCG